MSTISNKTLVLGGRKVALAALSLRQLRDLKSQIDTVMGVDGQSYRNEAGTDALIELVIASAKGAGETVDRDYLLDHINIANFADIGYLLFDRNGFLAKDDAQGEATAAPSQT
jgi:hypothetical protein